MIGKIFPHISLHSFMLLKIYLTSNNDVFVLDLEEKPVNFKISFVGPHYKTAAWITIYGFIFIAGTIGNWLVIKSFLTKSAQPGCRFVVALALVDFISSIWIPLLNIVLALYKSGHWPLGKICCYILRPFDISFMLASAWLLVAISLERAR